MRTAAPGSPARFPAVRGALRPPRQSPTRGLGRLASVIHPYPTQAEAIRQCGDAYNRTRLTPLVKSLFARWLAWRR